MKGTIKKGEFNDWYVEYADDQEGLKSLPLHSDDVEEILELSQVFDNIESRIFAYPNVEFDIFENQKLDGISKSAKLIKK